MKTLTIVIEDSDEQRTVHIKQTSEKQTWPWMLAAMIDAIRGSSFSVEVDRFFYEPKSEFAKPINIYDEGNTDV